MNTITILTAVQQQLQRLSAQHSELAPHLSEIAQQVALASDTLPQATDGERCFHALEIINRVAQLTTAMPDPMEMLPAVTREIGLTFSAKQAKLWLLNEQQSKVISKNNYERQSDRMEHDLSDDLIEADSALAQLLNDNEGHLRFLGTQLMEMMCPLIGAGQTIGLFWLHFETHVYQPDDNDLELLQTIMAHITGPITTASIVAQQTQAEQNQQRLLETLQYRTNLLQTAAEVSRAASSIMAWDELIETSVNVIRDKFDFYYVGMFLIEGNWAVLKAGTGDAGRQQIGVNHRLEVGGGSMIGWSIDNRRARIALDVGEDRVWFKNKYLPFTRSEMALPLISREHVLGALTVQSTRERAFSNEDITLLQSMADQLANALQNASLLTQNTKLVDQTQKALLETQQLYQISRSLVEAANLDEVYDLIIETVKAYDADRVSISLLERSAAGEIETVRIAASWDRDASRILPVGTEFSGMNFGLVSAFAQPPFEPLVAEDLRTSDQPDPRLDDAFRQYVVDQLESRSLFSAPMFLGSNYRGVISIHYRNPHKFHPTEIRLYQTMADQSIIVIENHQLLMTTQQERLQTETALAETRQIYDASQALQGATSTNSLIETLISHLPQLHDGTTFNGLAVLEPQWPDWQFSAHWRRNTGEISTDSYTFSRQALPLLRQLSADKPIWFSFEQIDEQSQTQLTEIWGPFDQLISLPLRVGANGLGYLLFGRQLNHGQTLPPFPASTLPRLTTLAGQMAIVMQNLKLVDETRHNLYRTEILSQLSEELLRAENSDEIYDACLEALSNGLLPTRGVMIYRQSNYDTPGQVVLVAHWTSMNYEGPTLQNGSRLNSGAIWETLVDGERSFLSKDCTTDGQFDEALQEQLGLLDIHSLAALPLRLDRRVAGFILVTQMETTPFNSDQVSLAEDIGQRTSSALEYQRLFQETQYRARLLGTTAEISQSATASVSLDTLLPSTVNLIRDRLEFYHASIFLVDEYQQYAVVRASTGPVGAQMLARGHKLAVGGRSIVGTATADGEPCIARDVGDNATHFNNPLLPDTRSEMALPLLVEGRVIGALDVQSVKPDAFSDNDITILQSMANQIANSIKAAQALEQAQEALDEAERVHQHYLRQTWNTYLREQRAKTNYQLTDRGFMSVTEAPMSQLVHEATVLNGSENTERRLLVPFTLSGEANIGQLELEIQDIDHSWDDETLSIVTAVANQATQALENARLFEQTQASREAAERLNQLVSTLLGLDDELKMYQETLSALLPILGLHHGQGWSIVDTDAGLMASQPTWTGLTRLSLPNIQALSHQPQVITDCANSSALAPFADILAERNSFTILALPLVLEDEIVGLIIAEASDEEYAFTPRDVQSARAMTDQLAISLDNKRLLGETNRRAVQLQTSTNISQITTSILDQERMLNEAVLLIQERFGFYHVQIYLLDGLGQYLVLHQSSGEVGQKLLARNYRVALGNQTAPGQAGERRQSIIVQRDDNRYQHLTDYLPLARREVAVPLIVRETLFGVLEIHQADGEGFSTEDVPILETLASQIAIALQNARAFQEQQATAARLKEIDTLKTQFLANMSHELRTPLNSIIGFSRVILKGIDGPLTELQKADLTSIHNSGQHLLGLINNILDLSKIEAGKMELNLDEVEMEPIVKQVMSTALALVKDKPVQLVTEVEENIPPVIADATRIRQVILNLVSNASKFTESGDIVVRAFASEDKVTVSVTDSGIGIPQSDLGSIFEEFTQVDASTTRKVGGTGLGLPISRHFIEMHKGQIWVESELGMGSTFSFAIPFKPLEDNEEDEGDETTQDQSKTNTRQKVVVIDSDRSVAELYKRFLRRTQYDLIRLETDGNLVDQVKHHAPNIILLDVILHQQDGWQVLDNLKQDPVTQAIPIIICSTVNDKARATNLGATEYLIKPIVENELLRVLHRVEQQQKKLTRVLVIDDQADHVLLIRRMLEAHGQYNVIEANDGREGLSLVESMHPDLIVLDLNLPEISGFNVVESLKANQRTKNIPIVIVSAEELNNDETAFLNSHVEVVLRKGIFTEDNLLQDVRRALKPKQ